MLSRQISDSLFKCSTLLSRLQIVNTNLSSKVGLKISSSSHNCGLPSLLTGNYLQTCRHYSLYSIRFEKRKLKRPGPPKDETPHLLDYMREGVPNQEDNEETRKITLDTIEKVNNQIAEGSHGRLFAVVFVMGRQHKITQDDILIIRGYWPPSVGDQIRLEKVLLAGGTDFTVLGKPVLPRDLVRIEATVIEKTLSYTQFHFRMLKRKNYRRLYFHKSPFTMLRINTIAFDGFVNEWKDVEGERSTIYTP